MSKLQELPPDNRAVLSLLLRQQRTYADIAGMLAISEQAVHDRAHAALILLSPRLARELAPERREEIGEYLLGQQPPSAGPATREHLLADPTALAWAQALHAELQDLAGGSLPVLPSAPRERRSETPVGRQSPAPAQRAPDTRPELPVSRRGGAILLGGILLVIVVVAILIVSGGKGSSSNSNTSAGNTTSSTTSTSTSATGTGTSKSGTSGASGGSATEPKVENQINLSAAESGSNAVAVAYVLSEGSQRAFYLIAEHLPKTEGFFYVVWLENSSGSARALGKAPAVGSDERLRTAGGLPSNAADYDEIIVTRETSEHPGHPGQVVLRGKFSLH